MPNYGQKLNYKNTQKVNKMREPTKEEKETILAKNSRTDL
jgi:hypothetical protein